MNGYVANRRGRFYAVIYEGLDPVTGRERRRWHPAGTDRAEAERLAARLAAEEQGRTDAVRSLTFGAYLTGQWLPAKKLQLAATTYRGYERNVHRHVIPALGGHRCGGYATPTSRRSTTGSSRRTPNGRRWHPRPSTRSTSSSAAPSTTPSARLAHPQRRAGRPLPRLNAIPRAEARSWTAEQLRQFLRTAAGHRYFPLLWLAAMTGMRRSEVLGLKWDDIDFQPPARRLNRGLVAVGYEVHQTRGKTRNARRPIDLDPTTLDRARRLEGAPAAEASRAVGPDLDGWVFTDGDGQPIHPHAVSQAFERIARRAGVPVIRLHELRHTHGTC